MPYRLTASRAVAPADGAMALQVKAASAGSDWFDLPKTTVTPELKRDLQLLRMRSILDPKRHYKKADTNRRSLIPEFSQLGTIVEGPTEFFSGRLGKKERKKSFVDDVLSRPDTMDRFKRRYNDVQDSKSSGKKAYYQRLKAQRSAAIKRR